MERLLNQKKNQYLISNLIQTLQPEISYLLGFLKANNYVYMQPITRSKPGY